MPEGVKKPEGQLVALNCDLERISGSLEELTAVLGKLCESQSQEENYAPKGTGGNEYVA